MNEKNSNPMLEQQVNLAAVIDHAHEGIMLFDEQGAILHSNPAADQMFGYHGAQWDKLSVHDLVPEHIHKQHQQWFAEELAGKSHRMIDRVREVIGRRKDGSLFPCEVAVHALVVQDKRQFAVILRDLSEEKRHQWVQDTLLCLRTISQSSASLHRRWKDMLAAMLSSPWPIAAAAIYTMQDHQLWLTASQGWSVAEKRKHVCIAANQCLCGRSIGAVGHMPEAAAERMICLPLMYAEQEIGLLHVQLGEGNAVPKDFVAFCRQLHEIVQVTMVQEYIRQTLEDSESKHRQLVETTPVGIIIQCASHIQYANPSAVSMLAAETVERLLHHEILSMVCRQDQGTFASLMQSLQQGNEIALTELRLQRTDGTLFWAEIRGVPVVYEGKPSAQVLIHDISDRKLAEDQLTRLSYTDELTGLPNRRLYIDRLEQACRLAARGKRQLCLLFIDLDRFKLINDTQGHACGDEVLKIVAGRILDMLRMSDTAARMGGDEFAVLLPETDPASAIGVADKLGQILKQPMHLGNQTFSIGASIGLAAYPDDGTESDTLLNHADSAMYHAKQAHLGVHCFSSEMEQAAMRRMLLERELAQAADRGQLQLYYQPQYRLESAGESFGGVESLIRWQHPDLGMVSPAEFIPIAEESGLISPITGWVIGEASRQARLWQQQGYSPGRIGINISAVELMQAGLGQDILGHIRAAGADPSWFEVEVTETAAMSQPETAIAVIQQLVDGGVSVAIDDFGTGYSSLAYLKRLPAHHLKIDIAFIRHLPEDAEDAVIVRTIIAMAHSLGLRVIAEGVETDAQLAFLRSEGCDMIQGYLLGKPMPADQLSPLLPSA